MSTPPSRPPAPGRARRFTVDEVVAASLTCLAADGLDRLTMRAVARELGASPMALYRYVADRDDLVARTVDRALADLALPDDPPPAPAAIRAWLREVLQRGRVRLLAYPGAADHLLLHGPVGPNSLDFMERVCGVLALTDRTPAEVAAAYDWLLTTAASYVSKETRLAGTGSLVAASLQRLAAEVARRPDLIPVVASFTGDVHAAFTRTTDLVIEALVPDQDA